MLAAGAISAAAVEEEVRLGYARPSLLPQLGIGADADAATSRPLPASPELMLAYDRASGFTAHRQLLARHAQRRRAIAEFVCQQASARHPWLAPWYYLRLRWRYGA